MGAGIIALPVKTAAAGFVPSAVALVAVWAFMNCTALLLLEMSLWFGPKSNVTTMALKTLGRPMKFICAALYLFIYMATLTAYIAEGASLSRGVVAAVAGYGSTPRRCPASLRLRRARRFGLAHRAAPPSRHSSELSCMRARSPPTS